ncbi:hypothetical protein [Streptomyces sp. NBC_00154]|uniref:hypothetical protein n=1 Tax=Streptomyces sp. NBC_00154 TaxID=2975670 RepID=UPI0022523C28|nr:hypothetical protein [Streptomyces sp. NBC_00154]MCX5315929.1 hypothetical protein [Streptomyces sp. NBC_00154]
MLPASYAVWDLLSHPELGDVRSRLYTERRALLLDLLHDVPPPIQAVPATDDPDVAQDWYDMLQGQGCLGTAAVSRKGCGSQGSNAFVGCGELCLELCLGCTVEGLRPLRDPATVHLDEDDEGAGE